MIPRVLAGIAALLMLATAYFHSTGLPELQSVVEDVGIEGFFAAAIPMQWLFFTWHLSILSVPVLWASIANPAWLSPAAIFIAMIMLGDFFWVFSLAGWFPGTVVLICVVGLLSIASAWRLRSGPRLDRTIQND